MDLNVNEGSRPSKLDLGRYAAGELSAEEAAAVEANLDDEGQAWLEAIEEARGSLPRFDAAALRARAGGTEVAAQPAPANNRAWYGVLALLAAALVAVVGLGLRSQGSVAVDPGYVGVRGGGLEVRVWEEGALQPWSGRAVGEGDRLGFSVDGTGHEGVVLLSVDGSGQVSVYWPAQGDAPEPLPRDGQVRLPGSLTLDGAPGPEVFLAVYDQTATEARDAAARTWQSGGPAALSEWAAQSPNVQAVVMERR